MGDVIDCDCQLVKELPPALCADCPPAVLPAKLAESRRKHTYRAIAMPKVNKVPFHRRVYMFCCTLPFRLRLTVAMVPRAAHWAVGLRPFGTTDETSIDFMAKARIATVPCESKAGQLRLFLEP